MREITTLGFASEGMIANHGRMPHESQKSGNG